MIGMIEEQTSSRVYTDPPEWATKAIWYQIFVERFYNGDKSNDPKTKNMKGAWPHVYGENWNVSNWTSDWYHFAPHSQDLGAIKFWYDGVQGRRYGGDLQGVINKLDYIKSLGVNAIYLNPINDAPSMHKYDARCYHHVDIHFGPNPERDKLYMQTENPADPSTWVWTAADKLMLELIAAVHDRGMRIIMDYSFNHTGIEFWAWKDVVTNGVNSEYADWYDINSFQMNPDPTSRFDYNGWANVKELPLIRKIKYSAHHQGYPYSGTLPQSFIQHIFDVTKRWLAPEGMDQKKYGIDGYRLDVADEIGLDFWQEFNAHVKSINPEAYLVGEVWWEKWPDTMMDPRTYISNNIFDSVMYYQPFKYARDFFSKSQEYQGAKEFIAQLKLAFADIPEKNMAAQMMMSASHDTPRLLSSFYNNNRYKFLSKPLEDIFYKTEKPNIEAYCRVKNYLIFLFTMPGAPQIWAGDEMGMWGSDDPDCRKPLWWPEYTFEPETSNPFREGPAEYEPVGFDQSMHLFYKKVIDLRKNYIELQEGKLNFLYGQEDILIYKRFTEKSSIYVLFNNSPETVTIEHLKISGTNLWNKKKATHEDVQSFKPLEFKIIRTTTT